MGIFSRKKKQPSSQNLVQVGDAVLNVMRDGVVIIDHQGNIEYINIAAANLANFNREESIGLKYNSVIHLVDQNGSVVENTQDPIAIVLTKNQTTEAKNFRIARTDSKETVPVCVTITPISADQNGSKVIVLRNIAKDLKEEQERSEFISTASHEMRSPVASIEGYLGLALNPQTSTIDERARAYLTKAHESSQHLGRLFRDLLDTSKLDDNRIKLHFVPIEMTAFIRNLADGMAPSITAKGLSYSFGENSPQAAKSSSSRNLGQLIYCSLDTDYLREIIDNLIGNAIKYTSDGSINVSIVGNKDQALITVSDTGTGISREHQNHIFQKFYRVDNSQTRNTEGTGLGLYIVKQRVEALHGRVWVQSEEGKGSKFFVAFPRISTEEYERQKLAATSTMAPQNPAAPPQNPTPQPSIIAQEQSAVTPPQSSGAQNA